MDIDKIIKRLVDSFEPVVAKPRKKSEEEYYAIKLKIVKEVWEAQKPFIEYSLKEFLKIK